MGNDIISELPESLITQILLWLPTKDSVKTSVLSTRWRNLWLNVPGLDLNSDDFPFPYRDIIKNFTERFLEFNSGSRLQKFKMKNNHGKYNVCSDRLKEWIATAVDKGIQHLDFETKNPLYLKDFMPMNIYKSKTLVSLKLVYVGLENPKFVVSLPCLKLMHLENIWYYNDGPFIVEKLISGCPVLEDLTLVRIHDEDLQARPLLLVRSLTLKIFRLMFDREMSTKSISVEIDAPKLKYMSFSDRLSDRIMVKNLSSLFKIDLDTEFGGSPMKPDNLRKRDSIRNFLTDISSVRHMIISQRTLEVTNVICDCIISNSLYFYCKDSYHISFFLQVLYHYSKLGPIPKFHKLSHLKAAFSSSSLQLLPTFLESCPNLKNLILVRICLIFDDLPK